MSCLMWMSISVSEVDSPVREMSMSPPFVPSDSPHPGNVYVTPLRPFRFPKSGKCSCPLFAPLSFPHPGNAHVQPRTALGVEGNCSFFHFCKTL